LPLWGAWQEATHLGDADEALGPGLFQAAFRQFPHQDAAIGNQVKL
jgi:hypothetical protein